MAAGWLMCVVVTMAACWLPASAAAAAGADLAVTRLTNPPGTSVAGSLLTTKYQVKNIGTRTAAASKTVIVLSIDMRRSARDAKLISANLPALRPGQGARVSSPGITSRTLKPRKYWLIVCVDSLKAVRERSEVNNCKVSKKRILVLDGVPPDPPKLTSVSPGSTGSNTEPVVSGTAESGSSIKLFRGLQCSGLVIGSGTANANGAFAIKATVSLNDVSTIRATARDRIGNVSLCSSTSVSYVHDDLPPALPTSVATSPVSPSALTAAPTLYGHTEQGAVVHVYGDQFCTGAVIAIGQASGTGDFTIPLSLTQNATSSLSMIMIDDVGNDSSCSTPYSYRHDNSPPSVPNVTSTTPNIAGTDSTPIVSGTAVAGSTVRVFDLNQTAACLPTAGAVATTTAAGNGTWSVAVTTPLGDLDQGDYAATAADDLDNESGCSASVQYTYDTSAPMPPMLTGPLSGGTRRPTMVGTTEPDLTVQLFTSAGCGGGAVASGVADGSGNFAIPLSTNLAAGSVTAFYTHTTDAAGNLSGCSGMPLSYTHDTTLEIVVGSTNIFTPNTKSVAPGTTLAFQLSGGVHNVQFTNPLNFANSAGAPGGTMGSAPHLVTFTGVGTYDYQCGIHGMAMTGSVTVN